MGDARVSACSAVVILLIAPACWPGSKLSLASTLKKFFATLFLLSICIGGLLAYDAYSFMRSPLDFDDRSFDLEVTQGDNIRGIAQQLSDRGLLSRTLWLELYARYTGVARRIKTGEYSLSTSATPVQLLTELQKGTQRQYSFTILEGWNIWQLRDALAKDTVLVQSITGVADDDLMQFIGADPGHPEGQFLPDTYLFPKGTTDAEFLKRANNALAVELAEIWENRQQNLPVSSPYEALVLASIIEKETSLDSEREMIAGVIAGRLRKGMRLQMDPTVIYGIGKSFNGNITRKDLKTPTPYNTYTIAGLPPTPIAMASAGTLKAAVNPTDTKALFFVADGTGGHVFNETVEAHNKAVRQYILKKK